ncbi:hypothetical protein LINPERHAP2_LOCUS28964 [Linum perenne]
MTLFCFEESVFFISKGEDVIILLSISLAIETREEFLKEISYLIKELR